MRVRVRYFAAVREALGLDEEHVDLPAGTSVAGLHRALEERHPALRRHRSGLRFAVAAQFAPAEATLADEADVALIPPVSGG
jgi:molybdopterin converting factor subunit 1